ncbi:MAG: AAA family ATPase, partial [candidate division NC10 bacterium]|nr:AAA family ATPase [candidate division NC10 bacterium]
SRLCDQAQANEILVGLDTCRQAEGYFAFQALGPMEIKGKAEPLAVYRVLSPKDRPITIHRLSGLKAELIGRRAEIAQLRQAVENLREGKGTIISICGDAGTGKSRLVEEFKATLDLNQVQWREGHAYAYAQNIPYSPLIDLLSRTFEIEEGDPPERVREKVESGIADLLGRDEEVVPYLGSLYALHYPEIEEVSPEFWKAQLQDAIQKILVALLRRSPTIFFFEDLHWADPSFLELLRNLLDLPQPAVVLCAYRPGFSLFSTHQVGILERLHQEIQLKDLSPSEAQDMLEALLKTKKIPADLRRLVQEKAEGNPFYLEELVNSLIESEILVRDDGSWRLTRSMRGSEISSTIQGVIAGRLDRLEKESKRILQEASVIGRTFLYQILSRITELKQQIDRCLRSLEHLDLIRTKALQPDLEYVFKHALTQEVVYNGLLKKERRELHERIGSVMEQLFPNRLGELCEVLAYHFKEGQSMAKAVDYLIRSGEKSLKRYAVEESHQYYREAYELLRAQPEKSREEKGLLIDLLVKWSLVYYYRGDFKGMVDLLLAHTELAESLDDRARLGIFYAWLGFGLYGIGKPTHAHSYLSKALRIGEEIKNQQVIGYACAWLSWTCSELGPLDEAIAFGERAHEIARAIGSDHYLYFKSLGAIAHDHLNRGGKKRSLEIATQLLDYGKKHSNIRCLTVGHICMGYGHFADGDFGSAVQSFQKACEVSADPFYSQWPRMFLAGSYIMKGQFQEAEEALQEVVRFCRDLSCHLLQPLACAFLGVSLIAKGQMSEGLKTIEDARQTGLENDRKHLYGLVESILGTVFLNIVEGAAPISLSTMTKNIGFLVKNVPLASKRAEDHFNKAIEVARETGAKGLLGRGHLGLGRLHRAKGRKDKARECICTAIEAFEQCEAEGYLKQAREVLESLEGGSS